MKKFLQAVLAMKEAAAVCYSAAMCILLVFLFCFGREEVPLSLLFSVLLASAAAGVLQVLAFTGLIIKKLAYGWRMLLFTIPFFIVLAATAAAFDWFPVERGAAWLWFGLEFIGIFALITIGLEFFYRLSGRKYDGLLGQYRKNRGK